MIKHFWFITMMRYLFASFAIVQFTFSIAQSKIINIGGLFTIALVDPLESGTDEVRAARLAVQAINNDTSLLPNHTVRLIPRDDLGSGWGGLRALCNLTREGIHGIIGPGWSSVSTVVGKACSAKHLSCHILLSHLGHPERQGKFSFFFSCCCSRHHASFCDVGGREVL